MEGVNSMAREILFKAKRISDGEWVYGNYAFNDALKKERHFIFQNYAYENEVDINTLCQYTGLTDKNGNKIWENDILNVHQFLFDGSEYENEIIVSIEYMEEMMCFGANLIEAKAIKEYMGYATDDVEKIVHPFNDFYGLHEESYEVIGNIFDNPELLGGGV